MNDHTRKLLDDAKNKKFDDVLTDLECDDIDINASDHDSNTLLHYASINNRDLIIMRILENFDVNSNAQDNSGRTPLHYAVNNGYVECINALLVVHNIEVNIINCWGRSPLASIRYSCESEKNHMCAILLEHGAVLKDIYW